MARKRRAKQTRLSFTPVVVSEPGGREMEGLFGGRKYASMGLEGGGKRKRGVEEDGEGDVGKFFPLFWCWGLGSLGK